MKKKLFSSMHPLSLAYSKRNEVHIFKKCIEHLGPRQCAKHR